MTPPNSNRDRWFAAQVLPHEQALRAWLRKKFPGVEDVDDLVQAAYERVLRAWESVKIESPKTFLFRTAHNIAIDEFRHRSVLTIDALTEIEEWRVLNEEPSVPELVGRKQEIELLIEAIKSLPERCRQVLTLRKIYGFSQKEIALKLGISEHTVEVHARVGVRRCAEFLARRGLP
jgi:RNA polymerase sigma-70 factor (ECF subfamily)